MDFAVTAFWLLHLLAAASIVGGWAVSLARPKIGLTVMAWAARAQLLIGLVLVNLTFAEGLNWAKLIVKLALALVVVALAEIANSRFKKGTPAPALAAVSAAVTVVISVISFLWH